MNKGLKYGIVGLGLVIIIGILASLDYSSPSDPEVPKEKQKEIDWDKSYDAKSVYPYGTYLFYQMLKSGLDKHSFEEITEDYRAFYNDSSNQKDYSSQTYVYVGASLNLNKGEQDKLMNFVNNGGTAFLSVKHIPEKLEWELFNAVDVVQYDEDTITTLKLNSPEFVNDWCRIKNKGKYFATENRWHYVKSYLGGNYPSENIGFSGYNTNYVQYDYGLGKFLFHFTPEAFTNVHFSTTPVKKYSEGVISYFPEGKIIWDNYYLFMDPMHNDVMEDPEGRRERQQSQLKLIFDNPTLMMAYFLILIMVLLFILFVGKRRQRVIPTAAENENTSLEFTDTVSRLYYLQKQHDKLVHHMYTIFLAKIRQRYYLNTNEIDEKFIDDLVKKSAVPRKEIKEIFAQFKEARLYEGVSDDQLIRLYNSLDKFYKNAR